VTSQTPGITFRFSEAATIVGETVIVSSGSSSSAAIGSTRRAAALTWLRSSCDRGADGARAGEVPTDDVWEHTVPLASRFATGVQEAIGNLPDAVASLA